MFITAAVADCPGMIVVVMEFGLKSVNVVWTMIMSSAAWVCQIVDPWNIINVIFNYRVPIVINNLLLNSPERKARSAQSKDS